MKLLNGQAPGRWRAKQMQRTSWLIATCALVAPLALTSIAPAADKTAFSGMLIVTPDKDWEQKWNTSPESIPYVAGGSTVKKGGELFVLTMLTHPQLDASGAASVSMDIDVTRPDGSSSSHAEGAVCVRGKVQGPVESLYLCGQVVDFAGEPEDPVGTWSVRIVLKDDVRRVNIPLTTSFVLVEK
jgi:hypothetical protein